MNSDSVMSLILTLKGRSSILSTDFVPPIELDSDYNYGLALLSFHSYNSIPNIEKNSYLYIANKKISIPEGSYEIGDIEEFIKEKLQVTDDEIFSLKPNNNTLKCEIFCKYPIDFTHKDSIGTILGFSPKVLDPGILHSSDLPVNIIKVRTIHIDSNITSGAFYNNKISHTIYEFAIAVDPGFAIDETPQHLIYLPVVNRNELHNITLRILDQDSEIVNFRGEEIIVRLELKKL